MRENAPNCFRLPPDSELDALIDQADTPYRMIPGHPAVIEHSYFDSFEGRLFKRGWRLCWCSAPHRPTWVLTTPKRTLKRDGTPLTEGALSTPELPPDIALPIADALGLRALLPMATARIRRTPVDCLNMDGKTVARLHVDRIEAHIGKHGPWRFLGVRCRLLALRGYEKPLCRMRHYLSESGRYTPCRDDLLTDCLDRLGIEPDRYSPRPRLELAPELRSDEAMKIILAALRDIMTANVDGIIKDIDSEFLHDFRTAVRRARTTLDQIRLVFPARRVKRLSGNLTWLGAATTPLRDLDVHLIDFPVYRQRLPKHLRSAFAPLGDLLESRRRSELTRLRRLLKGNRFNRFMNDWQSFVETPVPTQTRLRNAGRPIHATCGKRVMKAYDRICAEGLEIDRQAPPEALHRLRKRCKKLRYLLELFESCLPEPGPGPIIHSLKSLQDLLGGYQDCQVQAAALAAFKVDLDAIEPRSSTAIDWLLADLGKRQMRLRKAFHDTRRDFACTENRSLVQKLTKPLRRASPIWQAVEKAPGSL